MRNLETNRAKRLKPEVAGPKLKVSENPAPGTAYSKNWFSRVNLVLGFCLRRLCVLSLPPRSTSASNMLQI